MSLLWNNKIFWLIELLGIVIGILITVLHDVVIYEATTGLAFKWQLLITNPYIWGILVLQVLYAVIKVCVDVKTAKSDDRLKQAIENQEIKLIAQVESLSKKGDFTSIGKLLKVLDQLEERRNK